MAFSQVGHTSMASLANDFPAMPALSTSSRTFPTTASATVTSGALEQQQQEESKMFNLKNAFHNDTVSNAYYRLYKECKYTNTTIYCTDKTYSCHGLVLAANSDFFEGALDSSGCNKPAIVLHEVQGRIFEPLLEYMYTGNADVHEDDLADVLRNAQGLKIKGFEVSNSQFAQEMPALTEKCNSERLSSIGSLGTNISVSSPASFTATSAKSSNGDALFHVASSLLAASKSVAAAETAAVPAAVGNCSSHQKNQKGLPNPMVTREDSVSDSEEAPLVIDEAMDCTNRTVATESAALASGHVASSNPAKIETRTITPFINSMLQAQTHATSSSFGGLLPGSSVIPSSSLFNASSNNISINYYQQQLLCEQKASGISTPSFLGDYNTMIHNHILNNPPPADWIQMNQNAAAMATAISNQGRYNHSTVVNEDNEEEDEMVVVDEPMAGVATPHHGRRRQGRPASACLARDEWPCQVGTTWQTDGQVRALCDKEMADPSSLYRHRKIHTGEKPHRCPVCPKSFIQRYNMRQHLKTHRSIPIEIIRSMEPDLQEVFFPKEDKETKKFKGKRVSQATGGNQEEQAETEAEAEAQPVVPVETRETQLQDTLHAQQALQAQQAQDVIIAQDALEMALQVQKDAAQAAGQNAIT